MTYTFATVTGSFPGATGTVTFMPPDVITDLTETTAIIGPGGFTYPLSEGAFTSDPLLATDNAGLLPPGWTWLVTVALDGAKPYSYPVLIPSTPAAHDLDCLAINSTCMSGWTIPPAGDIGGTAADPTIVATHLTAPLPVAQGGTAAATGPAALTALGAAALAGAQFTGAVAPAAVTLTDALTVTVDAAAGNVFELLCTSAVGATRQLGAPSNPADGQHIDILVTQPSDDGGPCALTYDNTYLFSTGLSSPTLTTTAGYTDVLRFVYSAALAGWLLIACIQGFPGQSQPAELRQPIQSRVTQPGKGHVP